RTAENGRSFRGKQTSRCHMNNLLLCSPAVRPEGPQRTQCVTAPISLPWVNDKLISTRACVSDVILPLETVLKRFSDLGFRQLDFRHPGFRLGPGAWVIPAENRVASRARTGGATFPVTWRRPPCSLPPRSTRGRRWRFAQKDSEAKTSH